MFLLVLTAALCTLDPVSCPDGCTDQDHQQSAQASCNSSAGDCLFCQGGITLPVTLTFTMFAEASPQTVDLVPPTLFRESPRLEHPPRLV